MATTRAVAAVAVVAVLMTGAAKCQGGSVQVPGGPVVKVHQQQEQPEMRRQCPVCSGKGRVFGTRCRWCKGFGRVRL